jgi:hypothetical protein
MQQFVYGCGAREVDAFVAAQVAAIRRWRRVQMNWLASQLIAQIGWRVN